MIILNFILFAPVGDSVLEIQFDQRVEFVPLGIVSPLSKVIYFS